MVKLVKIILPVIFWAIFAYVILQVPYPDNITSAKPYQLLTFFIPLFLALTYTFNIFLKFILQSASLALGIIFLLILKALDSLNIVTALLTVVSMALLFSYFRKIKRRRLTKLPKIPKLTKLQKQPSSSRT